jgi:hypothetical protein
MTSPTSTDDLAANYGVIVTFDTAGEVVPALIRFLGIAKIS